MATKADISKWTATAEIMLQRRGVVHIPNEVPGLASAVTEALRQRFPDAHLTMDRMPLGDEATLRSDDYLGTKSKTS